MAKPPDPFHEFVIELFAGLGPVTVRRMFGGAGVFQDGRMFALLADEQVYIKADEALRAELVQEGGAPFIWVRPSDGKTFDMGYVGLPTAALDDPEEAAGWGRRAISVARAASEKKPARRSRRKS